MHFLTAGGVADLADAMAPWYRTFILTAAYTGLRWSELVGLRNKRVDLLRRTITVAEQLLLLDNGKPAGLATAEDPSGCPLDRRPRVPRRDAAGPARRTGPDGPRRPDVSKSGRPADRVGQLQHRLLHAGEAQGRHRGPPEISRSEARRRRPAIAQGAHPKAIQARMGHSSVQMTLDRYGHLFPELDERVAIGLDECYRSALAARRAVPAVAALPARSTPS